MSFQESLDSLPIGAFFVAYTVVAATISESGYRLGNWWQERTPEEREGPTGMIVGSLLALMAFLLATATGMAGHWPKAKKPERRRSLRPSIR